MRYLLVSGEEPSTSSAGSGAASTDRGTSPDENDSVPAASAATPAGLSLDTMHAAKGDPRKQAAAAAASATAADVLLQALSSTMGGVVDNAEVADAFLA